MASRVGASIVSAVGCPELVVHNLSEYEEKAVHLATHPQELQALRSKLAANRLTHPLFNTTQWVSNWEEAVQALLPQQKQL